MFASILVKFVGKLCTLLNLSPSLLLLWPLVLLSVDDKTTRPHLTLEPLRRELDSYIVFHIPGSLLLLLLFFLFIDSTY